MDGASWDTAASELGKAAHAAVAALDITGQSLTIAEHRTAADGTTRLALRTVDGRLIETVIIPNSAVNKADGDELDGAAGISTRTTVCVSSQVGCGRGCAFCETGVLGLFRQLSSAEIVAQIRVAMHVWAAHDGPPRPPITNVVFMGMGEPLDNLDAVVASIDVMTHDLAWGLSARRITVSTVGVARQIPAFFARTRANLAVSLNAPDDARRSQVMPVGRRTSMADIRAAILGSVPAGRDVLFEYVLFDRFNDQPEDADLLVAWLAGMPARLNLIAANPGPDPSLRQPDWQTVHSFARRLLDAGVRAMVRYPHGRDVGGACGQLAGELRR